MSKISVIIPNYNRAGLVVETVKNMQAQSLSPMEIIVVDDGSTDNSIEVLRELEPKITLVEQSNQGPGAARNVGLSLATGEYIQFMDSDDLASLNKLQLQVEVLEAKAADMAFCPWFQIEWGGGTEPNPQEILQASHPGEHRSLLDWHLRGWVIILQNCLFRRSFLERVGEQRTDLLGTEDWEFFDRIFIAEPNVVFTPDCLVLYRLHESGKLSGSGTTDGEKARELAKAARYIIKNLGNKIQTLPASTKFLFEHRIRKIERDAKVAILSESASLFHKVIFCAFTFVLRVGSKVKRQFYGYPWHSYYHATKPKEKHLQILQDVGIK